MAITLTEDWSAYADNTEVQNISGWTTAGAFPADQAGQKVNATSQLKNSSGNGCLAYYDSGSSSHYSKIVIDAPSAASAAQTIFGPAVRCIDQQNFISLQPFGVSNIKVYSKTGNVDTTIATIGVAHASGDSYELRIDGETLTVYQNDIKIGGDYDITGVHSGNNAGMWAMTVLDPSFGDLEIGTLSSDTISIDASADRKIFPVFGATRNHTISGTYSGATVPTTIEYRVEEFVGGATVIDWAELDAAPSAGVYSGVVAIPKGDFYKILTRFSNAVGINGSTNRIGFGILAEFGGQSNVVSLFATGNIVTPSDNTAIFDKVSTWSLPTTQIVSEALNALSVANSCVVGCYSTAVGATIITAHLSGGSNYPARQAALTAAGSELNFFYWGLGETDAANGNQATHQANLVLLRSDILTRTSQASASLPMFVVSLGRNEGGTGNAVGWQGIRAAQTNFANSDADVYISHQTMDLPMADALHRNGSGSIQECLRFADSHESVVNTGNSGRGPIPTSAEVSGSDVVISHDFNGSTLITLPASSLDGYEVSDDNFSSLLTINSIATATDKVTLTTSAPITGEVKIRSQQGQDPDVAKMPVGDQTYNAQPVMVEPIVTELQSAAVIPSIINLTATGLPDGTYSAQLWDDSTDPMTRVKVENITFTSGFGSSALTGLVVVGTAIYTRIDTPTPLVTGVTCIGVTE